MDQKLMNLMNKKEKGKSWSKFIDRIAESMTIFASFEFIVEPMYF